MGYEAVALPFTFRRLTDGAVVAVSESGDHLFLTDEELSKLSTNPASIPLPRRAAMQARFFVRSSGATPGVNRLLLSRRAAKRETTQNGPSLHIIVPTLQCAHSCRYCQVSRSLSDTTHAMTHADLDAACDSIFESPSQTLTVEFQGGDPLLRFDLLERAILRISSRNDTEGRNVRFVVATTLHQLDGEMCAFFAKHRVFVSTSLDGPSWLHNKNRPTPTRDSHQRTVAGISLARQRIGEDSVSALMTTTRESLKHPEEIVDEYVRLGFSDIFLRPLSSYGFAKRNQALLGYSLEDFFQFYKRAFMRVLHWNKQGYPLREVYASIVLNKILSTFDSGYVDLQSPTGAGSSVLVYNYDGYVYPSDEARMLAETGDKSLRLGRIGDRLADLIDSPVRQMLVEASTVDKRQACRRCAYNQFCAPNPIDARAQFGDMLAPVDATEHCQRHLWLFDEFFLRLRDAGDWETSLFHSWARPLPGEEQMCAA